MTKIHTTVIGLHKDMPNYTLFKIPYLVSSDALDTKGYVQDNYDTGTSLQWYEFTVVRVYFGTSLQWYELTIKRSNDLLNPTLSEFTAGSLNINCCSRS